MCCIFARSTACLFAIVFAQLFTVYESGCSSKLLAQETAGSSEQSEKKELKTAVLAGGCFWCTETDFEKCPGVVDVVSGYSGGTTERPNYQTYHDGHHTECALITYDPAKVTFGGLVEWLVKHIDATDATGQFYDRGEGYMPIVFYANEDEKVSAERVFKAIDEMKILKKPVSIALKERTEFWPAEEYHQDYHHKQNYRYSQYRTGSGRDRLSRMFGASEPTSWR